MVCYRIQKQKKIKLARTSVKTNFLSLKSGKLIVRPAKLPYNWENRHSHLTLAL